MAGEPWMSLDALARRVEDGSSVALGGWMLDRPPMALAAALARRPARGLALVSVASPLPVDLLAGAGCAASMTLSHVAIGLGDGRTVLPALARAGTEAGPRRELVDEGRLVQRLRAAGTGLPFLPWPEGLRVARVPASAPRRVADPHAGGEVGVEPALRIDVALLHAPAADARGNVLLPPGTHDALLAAAAARVLVTVEERVERLERATLPGWRVSGLALVPGGASPGGVDGHAVPDTLRLAAYLEASRAGRPLDGMGGAP